MTREGAVREVLRFIPRASRLAGPFADRAWAAALSTGLSGKEPCVADNRAFRFRIECAISFPPPSPVAPASIDSLCHVRTWSFLLGTAHGQRRIHDTKVIHNDLEGQAALSFLP